MGSARQVGFFLLVSACASVGTFQTPQTLGRGHFQVALETSVQALTGVDAVAVYGLGGVSIRAGVHDAVDVGARLGPGGLEAQAKVRLTPRTASLVVSLAPSAGGTYSRPNELNLATLQFALPVLIGIVLNERLQLIFAPRLHDSVFLLDAGQAGATVNTFQVGAAAGVAIRLGAFTLIPDVGFLAPLAVTTFRSDLPSGTAWALGRWPLQANVTVTYTGRWPGHREVHAP